MNWKTCSLEAFPKSLKEWRARRNSNLRRLGGVSGAGASCRNPERSLRRTSRGSLAHSPVAAILGVRSHHGGMQKDELTMFPRSC
jgi:hypothetical protein